MFLMKLLIGLFYWDALLSLAQDFLQFFNFDDRKH